MFAICRLWYIKWIKYFVNSVLWKKLFFIIYLLSLVSVLTFWQRSFFYLFNKSSNNLGGPELVSIIDKIQKTASFGTFSVDVYVYFILLILYLIGIIFYFFMMLMPVVFFRLIPLVILVCVPPIIMVIAKVYSSRVLIIFFLTSTFTSSILLILAFSFIILHFIYF